MVKLLESFPEQIQSAAEMGEQIVLPRLPKVANLVVTGLGGSAIGGDVIRSVVGDSFGVPFLVNRDYCLPTFVNDSSLVIACSYSGNTEETLSALDKARRARASTICVTSGGKMAALAETEGIPVVRLPPGYPPRAALGYSSILLLAVLRALGLVPDQKLALQDTVHTLLGLLKSYGIRTPEEVNKAKSIARSLHSKIVGIYGSNGLTDAVAARWRGQLEENGKNLAFHHLIPEMNHNELVGWKYPVDELRSIGVIFLRDKADHLQVQRRFDLTRELVAVRAGVVHEVWSEGDSLLARVFSLIYLGDFVSLYLAYLNGVDPTPVDAIETLKQRLIS